MIFRSPIFRRLLASAFVLIAATLLVLDFLLARLAHERRIENVERQLEAEARILSSDLQSVPRDQLEKWAAQAATNLGARLTFVDPKGVVLADSRQDPASLENFSGREEIQRARQAQEGTSVRRDEGLGTDVCYFAVTVNYLKHPGYVLRLGVSLPIDAAAAAVHHRILAASLVAALLALSVTYLFSRSITLRIDRLKAFAETLVEVKPAEPFLPEDDDELGYLARSLNQASAHLRGFVDRMSLETARRDAIFSSMIEGVLAVDNELRILFGNDSFARAVGARRPLVERLPLLEFVRDPRLLEILTRVLVSGQSVQARLQLGPEDGVFQVHASPLAAPSRRGAIVILHDITDLERLERIRKDFVANVSHELRTPLTAIRGYAETLLDGAIQDSEVNRTFLEAIKAHAVRLNNIASDLLALSELESGKRPDVHEPVSLREALDSAMRAIEPEANLRGVRMDSSGVSDLRVLGQKLRLEQALVNLLDNAIKFNRPDGNVAVAAELAPDGKARITIKDTGIGIPSHDLPRIFERFYRVDKARSREMGGTGLGLAIVRHSIERMNGSVFVESELGVGSTFTILLPIAS